MSSWVGVMNGLRKGRKIYVRIPKPNEKNAIILLIPKGAIAVDYNGSEISNVVYSEQSP
jgi:DNA processing protein